MKSIRLCRKAMVFCLMLCLLVILAAGCGLRQKVESKYGIYFLNQDRDTIVRMDFMPVVEDYDTTAFIDELLIQIRNGTDDVEYQKVYPDDVKILNYVYRDHTLSLYFSSEYANMQVNEEVLCRGAIVQTLLQVPDVNGILFYVDGNPLLDVNGNEVGLMTSDSFVSNPGEKINNIQVADLTLYFPSEDGEYLVSETQHVNYYSSNISQEKLVMERLIAGPKSSNAQAVIPDGTRLLSVSVMDGVCLVNLDSNFLTQNYAIREDVVIYSIVDSLCEVANVEKVQLSVNGETNMFYRQDMSLNEYYTMNKELVMGEGEDVDVDQQEQENKEGLIDTGQ